MSTLLTLILTKLRKTTKKAIEWLIEGHYQTLFLGLPEDLTNFLNEYLEREISKEEFWQSVSYLTGLQEPYINALRYRMDPLLNTLPQLKDRVPRLEIYCYHNLDYYLDAHTLSEKTLFLETSERIRSKIKVGAWRELLEKKLELNIKSREFIMENISFHAEKHPWNTVLYGGVIKSFKKGMENMGFKVKIIHLHNYWRSPLEVLGNMAQSWGIHNLSDDLIIKCVESHLRYLDYVLLSQDIDFAHDKWVSDNLHGISIL